MYIIPQLSDANNEIVALIRVRNSYSEKAIDLCCEILRNFQKKKVVLSPEKVKALLEKIREEIFVQFTIHSIPYEVLSAAVVSVEEDLYND